MDILTNRHFFAYSGVSTALVVGKVLFTFSAHPTFFSACIALSEGLTPIVIGNWLLVCGLSLAIVTQKFFFGELRLLEREHVAERAWLTIISSLVALAMFRHEHMMLLCGLSLLHLFLVVFHWIVDDRIDFLFQRATALGDVLKTRVALAALVLMVSDWQISMFLLNYSFQHSPDICVVFGFQVFLLFLTMSELTLKSVCNLIEIVYLDKHPDEEVWELRSVYVKVIGIIHSFFKLVINALLCYIFYGPSRMPIHLGMDMFHSVKTFITQCKDFLAYLRTASELDGMLPDATMEQLADDNLCIICREDMTTEGIQRGTRNVPKVLPCGHIIHMGCLKGWMERSQVCPMCRQPVKRTGAPAVPQERDEPAAPEQRDEPGNAEEAVAPQHFETPPVLTPQILLGAGSSHETFNSDTNPHSITLPLQSAVIPRDWAIIPLTQTAPMTYNLHLTPTETAQLSIQRQSVAVEPASLIKIHGDFSSERESELTDASGTEIDLAPPTAQEQARQLSRDIDTMRSNLDGLMNQLSELNAKLELPRASD
ncbi:hypothetical protein BABINDRAFT_164830 [Babjeviella inositovora NRRL Y-12698]|uniref:RING-type E3 ubiquitin transferase n=1 Tax=Babjeviella inositovora NRRL Y-12698 TaxID=984486 RepID=A0A1E3QZW4_9ASCO|nr:uncharacterized protein BABINDRAFT_164830 [Babjeviella inositovora NRRL Y-12698]ODQ83125.1 hypothetical protein BABINDRAFT_164830 [Babjeviella inositovora NRRL Y-12698]